MTATRIASWRIRMTIRFAVHVRHATSIRYNFGPCRGRLKAPVCSETGQRASAGVRARPGSRVFWYSVVVSYPRQGVATSCVTAAVVDMRPGHWQILGPVSVQVGTTWTNPGGMACPGWLRRAPSATATRAANARGAGIPNARTDAAMARNGCHARAGARIVASSRASHSQVYRKHLTVGGRSTLRYWGCTRSSGDLVRLYDSKDYGSFGKTTFGRLAFAGPYLAALVTRSAPPFEELVVRFYDLSGTLAPYGAWLGESTAGFRALLLGFHLSSTGRFAWLQRTGGEYGGRDGLRALGRKPHHAPAIYHLDDAAAGVITAVRLEGTHLTWRHGGAVRRATLLIASRPRG
jgi:hypothetical protein